MEKDYDIRQCDEEGHTILDCAKCNEQYCLDCDNTMGYEECACGVQYCEVCTQESSIIGDCGLEYDYMNLCEEPCCIMCGGKTCTSCDSIICEKHLKECQNCNNTICYSHGDLCKECTYIKEKEYKFLIKNLIEYKTKLIPEMSDIIATYYT